MNDAPISWIVFFLRVLVILVLIIGAGGSLAVSGASDSSKVRAGGIAWCVLFVAAAMTLYREWVILPIYR
jgi:hypothetical protein